MGGKHSRQQREQKQQTVRKQRKEKKSSQRSTAGDASRNGSRRNSSVGSLSVSIAAPEQQQTDRTQVVPQRTAEADYSNSEAARNGSGTRWTVADVTAGDSPVNVTESDGQQRVGAETYADHNEHAPEVSGVGYEGTENVDGGGAGGTVTTITICMLKMEPNAANETAAPVESGPANDGGASAATGGDVTGDGEPVEDASVTPIAPVSAPTIDAELLSMPKAQCGCFENGNCSSAGFVHATSAIGSGPVTVTASTATPTLTHPTVTSGPIPTITSSCNCNATPLLIGASSAAMMDNRLNNNSELHPQQQQQQQQPLLLADGGGGTVVLTMPGGPTPTTTSSFAAASACASVAPATTAAPMWPSVSSSGVSPARSQSFGNFMLRGGADSASLVQHLIDRVRHHQHRHHHHHHNHFMHFLPHHHHGPVSDATQSEPGPTTGAANTSDWRLHVLRQYRTQAIPTVASEPVYGIPTSPVTRGGGGVSIAPPLLAPAAFLDIDMKDKLEGLDLGTLVQRPSNNNLSPPSVLPTLDTSGEHPRSVGECPTCCAMALAAKASGASLSLLAGADVSVGGSTTVFNGNVGEVEEKILNTVNQQTPPTRTSAPGSPPAFSDAAGGEESRAVSAQSLRSDHASTGTATNVSEAGPSSAASSATTVAATAESSTQVDAGKDAATRTVDPATVPAADCDQIMVDGNSPNLTTTATLSAVSTGSVAPIGDSSLTTTAAAGSTSVSPAPASSTSSAPRTPATPNSSNSTSSNSSSPPTSTVQCCRKQSPSSGSSSAAATLLHSLSLSGRRSRNSSTTPPCNCSYCASGDGAVVEPQQTRSFANWISGGQKGDRNGSSGSKQHSAAATTTSSPVSGSAKSKKPNWRVSLNCTIRRAAGGSSGTSGHSKPSRPASSSEQSSGRQSVSSGGSVVPSAASADIGHNSIGSAGSSSVLRGSSLISSSASAKLLKGESDKDDTCVCTAYRKMSESPPPISQSQRAGGSVSPARPLSPAPATNSPNAVSDDPAFIPLNMLSLVTNSADGSTPVTPPRGLSAPVTNESLSSLLHNHHHHHHHHHHAMAAAALAADHHQSFFFPASSASPAGAAAVHHHAPPNGVAAGGASSLFGNLSLGPGHSSANGVILLSDPSGVFDLSSDDFSLEDCDERARIQRELEIREGVDAPPNFHPRRLMSGGTITSGPAANHPIAFFYSRDLMQRSLLMANRFIQPGDAVAGGCAAGAAAMAAAAAVAAAAAGRGAAAGAAFGGLRIHSQVDFIHCLVPDLQKITSCSFYWGKMDRYEAERLLEGKPEGTFLLRDSAQEEFLFSVSFRKYNRSLHARIEQFNHKFSFDSRDPGVYTASTVTGLLEHYKDPSCVMFFEPMLTYPLNRNFSFSLQQLCRAAIVSNTTYDGINELALPKSLKAYLKEYHYRQRVRFRPLDEHLYSNA